MRGHKLIGVAHDVIHGNLISRLATDGFKRVAKCVEFELRAVQFHQRAFTVLLSCFGVHQLPKLVELTTDRVGVCLFRTRQSPTRQKDQFIAIVLSGLGAAVGSFMRRFNSFRLLRASAFNSCLRPGVIIPTILKVDSG